MAKLELVLLAFVAGTCVSNKDPLFDSQLDDLWLIFKKTHGKIYEGETVEASRRLVWESHVTYVRKHNLEADMGIHSHHLGINEYADLTDDEYKQYLTGFRHRNQTSRAPVFMAPGSSIKYPETVDWRKEGYVTPVKNQKACGSCWAFSATGSLEGQHFKKTGELVSLSEQNLIDCAKKEGTKGCKGGSMDAAFKYIKLNNGIDTEDSYPYTAKDGYCHYDPEDKGATDAGYMDIEHGDEEALMQAVATIGPISVAIDASKKDFRFYKSGVYTSSECSSTHLDHGVLVVGYGSDEMDDYWLVKNSWGPTWGDKGYIKMRRNHHNMCGIATIGSYPLL